MEIPENQTDAKLLMALSDERQPLAAKLDELYEKWTSMQEEAH
jgi:hypothetical protein